MKILKMAAEKFGLTLVTFLAFSFAAPTAYAQTSNKADLFRFGSGTTGANKVLQLNVGSGTTNPQIRYNVGNSKLEFSSDGSNFFPFLPFTALGDLHYGGASGAPTVLSGNTTATPKFLGQTGTGSVSAAPTWVIPQFYSDSAATQLRFITVYMSGASNTNCTSNPCTATSGGNGFGTLTRNSSGNYTINFSPAFSSAPVCFASCDITGSLPMVPCGFQSAGTSTDTLIIANFSGTATDGRANILCVGPK